ncbi:MAG TPA: mechanosensitive ion channel domain-containing protein [Acidobacteriaceae bacterium]|nr:mechanosensitive ion channel domain-containing protein [Acidobacteriaceae bacterium]
MPLSAVVPQEEHSLLSIEHGWHADLLDFAQRGLPKVVVALLIAFVAQRLVLFFTQRLRRRADALVGNGRRAAQLRTVAGIVRASAYGLIGFYVFLQVLGAIGVPLGPFIASAGVIGLGVSFGAQSLFKDMLNGLFILIEDQYSVGDTVKIAGLQGSVEDLTLRCTKLRDGDGTLYIVPNSQIATVSNLSRDFSVASLALSVSSREDPDRVVALLKQLAAEVRADGAFKDVLLSDPDVPGVDRIAGREVTYPINVRVQVNQRDGVLRELRRRILLAFEREGIELGAAANTLIVERPDPTTLTSTPANPLQQAGS